MGSYSWNGTSGGWGTLANWTGGIPNSTTADALINAPGAYVVTLEAGKSYTVDSVSLSDSTAVLDIAGTLALGGTLALVTLNGGTLDLSGVIAGGTVNIDGGSTLVADGGTLENVATFYQGGSSVIDLNNQNLALTGAATLQGYVIGAGSLVISGTALLTDDVYFESGVTLVDTGIITLASNTQLANNGTAATEISIASGGIFDDTAVNSAINNNGTANIINAGTFENVSTTASYINIYANFTNTSTGLVTIAAGDDISLLNGADLNGKILGAGILYLGSGVTTLEAGLSLNVGTITENGGNTELLLESNRAIGNDFVQTQTGSTIALNGHNLTLTGSGAVGGYVNGPGTLDIAGSIDVSGLYLSSGATELVTGLAVQSNSMDRLNYDNGSLASVLSIASTGTYDVTAINSNIDYNGARGIMLNAGLFENTATVAGATNALVSYFNDYENYTQTSTGTLVVGTADDISLLGATNALAGTITGAGDLYIGNGGTTTLEAGLVINNGRYFTVSDGNTDVILTTNQIFAQQFREINGANLSLNGNTLSLTGAGTLGGYLAGPGTLDVTGTFYTGEYLSAGVTEVLSGTEIQYSTTYFDYNEGTGASVLSITSTGTYDITSDSQIYNGYNNGSGTGTIINAGLFEKTGYSSYTNIYTNFTNTGRIFIAAGNDISLITGTNNLAGTITGPGDFYLGQGSQTTLQAGLKIGNLDHFTVGDGGTNVTFGSSQTIASIFTDENGADVLLNTTTLTLSGTSSFYNAYVSGPGELLITGHADFNAVNFIGTMSVVDAGTIIQDGYNELGTNNSAQVVMSITSTGTYDIINDTYINPQNGAPINNAGLFEKTGGGGISDIYAVFNNQATGTINAATGLLRLDSGGTLGGLLAGGTLDLNGGTFSLLSTALLQTQNFYETGGTLQLESSRTYAGAFNLGTGGNLDLNGFNLSLNNPGDYLAGIILGAGTITEAGRADIYNLQIDGTGMVLQDTGTLTQDGAFYLNYFAGSGALLSIASTGIYDIVNDSYIYTSNGAGSIDNAGLFEKTAATGGSNIYAAFNNAAGGTLAVDASYIQLLGGGALAGTLTGPGSLYLGGGTFALAAAAVLNVGTLNVNGGQLNLQSSRTLTDIFNETSGDVNLAGFNLTLSNQDQLVNAYLSGPGTLAITGVTQLQNYSVTGGAVLQDSGTIIQNGNLFVSNASTDTGTLNISAGAVYNIATDSNICDYGTAALNNAGLLEKTAGTGTSVIYTPINNTGTIDAVRGLIDLVGGGTLAGTLAGGVIDLAGGTFALQSAAVVSVATLNLAGGALSLAANRTLTDQFNQSSATIALAGHTLTLSGHDSLSGTEYGAGTIDITGTTDISNLNLTGGVVLLDAATITQDGALQLGLTGTDSAILSIASTGTYDILNDNYIYETGTVAVINAGLFEKTGSSTGRTNIQGAFTNTSTGTVALTTGILEAQALTNDGVVKISNGFFQTDNNVVADTGKTGTFQLTGNATLDEVSGIAASQTIALSGANNEIIIGNASVFAGTITGFAAGDTIDLQNTIVNGFSYANNKLVLTENGVAVDTIALTGIANPGSFSLVQDGATGTLIEYTGGTITQPGGNITTDTLTLPGSATSVDFNTAADWSGGTIANATNTAAFIGGGTVTDSGKNTVYSVNFNGLSSVGTFTQTAGTLTVIDGGGFGNGIYLQSAGATLIDQSGILTIGESGTLAGTLAGAGQIILGGNPGNGIAAITIAAGAVLNVATLGIENAILAGNQTFGGVFEGYDGFLGLNGFTLSLTGQTFLAPTYAYQVTGPGELILAGNAQTAQFSANGGAVIEVTGTFTTDQNVYLNSASSMAIASTGTFDLTGDSGAHNGPITNAGLFEKTGDNGQSLVDYSTITNTGIVDVTTGSLNFQYDTATFAGTLEGAGQIEFSQSTVTLAPSVALNAASLYFSGSNVFLSANETYGGNFILANNGTLELGSNNLTLTGTSALGGVYVSGNGTIGAGTLDVKGSAEINGLNLINNAELLIATSITADGEINLGNTATDTSSMVINAGETYNIVVDAGISGSGTGGIYNAGLFEKTAATGNSYIQPAFTNASTGTIDVASGLLLLQNGGTLAGLIEGAGALYLQNNNGSVTLASTAIVTVATLNVNDNLILNNALNYTGDFVLTNNFDLNGYNASLTGSAALDSSVQGSGTLTVTHQADINGLYLYQGAAMVDAGTITQDGGFSMSNQATDSTSLSITSTGVFDILTNNNINNNGTAVINNAGLFEKTGDYGNSSIYASFNNTGTIDAQRGFLYFDNGGNFGGTLAGGQDGTIADGGIFANGGLFNLGATAVLSVAEFGVDAGTLALGGNLIYGGSFVGAGGSLALNGHTISVTAPSLGGFVLAGPGTMNVSGTAILNGLDETSGALLIDKGTIIDEGGYQLGNLGADSAELSITGAGTFNLITDNYIGASGTASVVNAGLFEKNGANGYSGIESSFTNQSTGIVDVLTGSLGFNGGGNIGGTLTGAGAIVLNSNTDTLTSSIVTVATVDIEANPTLGANLTYGGYLYNQGGGDNLHLDGHTLVLTGTMNDVGGFEGPGEVVLTGQGTINGANLLGGATLVDSGTITQTGVLYMGLTDGSSNELSITGTGTYAIANDSNFQNYGAAGATESVINAGLLEKTGDTGLSELQVLLTNTGTAAAYSGTLLVDSTSNLTAGTLSGGTWIAAAGFLAPTLSIGQGSLSVDAAAITLSGAGSEITVGGTFIETSLLSITSGGVLAVDGNRGFATSNNIADAGKIILQGGTFADASLTIAIGASFAGFGALTGPVTDNGLIAVTGSTLNVQGAITGAGALLINANDELILGAGAISGTSITFGGGHAVLALDAPGAVHSTLVSLAPSDTIDLVGTLASSATIIGNELVVSLTSGGTLGYSLAGATPLTRVGTSSDGHGGTKIVSYYEAVASPIAPTPVNFGEQHAGAVASETFTISNTAPGGGYSENLNASMGAHSGGVTDSGSFTGLAAGGTNNSALQATLVTSSGGVVSGTATVNLSTTGAGVSGDNNGTLALPSQTVSLTGTVFNYATASTVAPVNFGQHHVGDTLSQFILIDNTATPGAYSEGLDAGFSGTSSNVSGSGSVTTLAAGGANGSSLSVGLNSGTAGVQSGSATLGLTSDGTGIDTLSSTGLASQTVGVSGTLFNYATASAVTPVNFGIVHVGQAASDFIVISNNAAPGAYSEGLDAGFSGTSTGFTSAGSLTGLAAGGTSSNGLSIGLNTSKAGIFTGTSTLGLASDGSGIDSLGTTALGSEIINLTGTVNNYATVGVSLISGPGKLTATGATTLHLNLGSVAQNSTDPSENIGIVNAARGPADLLSGSLSLSGSTSAFIDNSAISFSGIAAGSVSTGHTISLKTNNIGTFSETIVLHASGSNASGYSGTLTAETFIVTGTVTAAAAVTSPGPMRFIAPAAAAPATQNAPLTGQTAWMRVPALTSAPTTLNPPAAAPTSMATASPAGVLTPYSAWVAETAATTGIVNHPSAHGW